MGKVLRSEVVFPTLTLGESEAEKSCNLADWQINGSEARWRSVFFFVRVKCRDQTVVNNLFKLSNLIDKFFIRIKHSKNKQNRVH